MFAGHGVAKVVSTAILVAALGLITASGSAADSTDDAFLRSISADALTFDNPEGVIGDGSTGLRVVFSRAVAGERSLQHAGSFPTDTQPDRAIHGRRGPRLLP